MEHRPSFLRSYQFLSYSINSPHFMEPEGSLPHSQQPASVFGSKHGSFYCEKLLPLRTTPRLEDHPSSPVRDCLFNIFAAILHMWRPFLHPQPEDASCRGDRDPLTAEDNINTVACSNSLTHRANSRVQRASHSHLSLFEVPLLDPRSKCKLRNPICTVYTSSLPL